MADTSFVLFTLGPVQSFIKAARTVRDQWSGSYLLSYLTFRAMESVARQSGQGAGAIVFPDVTNLPLWKWDPRTRAALDVLEPCIPNRFLAEVRGGEAAVRDLAEAAEGACRQAWAEIAESVRTFLFDAHGHPSFAPDDTRSNLWYRQIDTFFEVYTAVLPQNEYPEQLLLKLLGEPPPDEPSDPWSRRHQVAQKALAAVKSRRHFPVYAPKVPDEVPQKDTLLGTLEHMGPGNRQEANRFWEAAADRWTDRGSRVNDGERLCAVSLVKRFAWAQHFSKENVFDLNPQRLRFDDTPTVAAAVWLGTGTVLDPLEVRDEYKDWSGTWLHREKPDAPTNPRGERIKGERPVPPAVWGTITEKRRAQGKPPTYYAMFVFDGDKMGDRFNAATSAPMYRTISNALGNFAIHVIKDIVEEHHGELIYAGGDDAICVLPTATALACVKEINAVFRANWDEQIKPIADQLKPELRKATISGGLVIAHYKEDLRFVMEEAHKAESRSKGAGRDALMITVCRRSGEHTSAVVPWGFVSAVNTWVDGFLKEASDRWAYKLRADLPVLGSDPEMFRLELGRQLNRAEDGTKKVLPAGAVQASFDEYRSLIFDEQRQADRKEPATDKDTITDFVTLLQTASFLARGRDA